MPWRESNPQLVCALLGKKSLRPECHRIHRSILCQLCYYCDSCGYLCGWGAQRLSPINTVSNTCVWIISHWRIHPGSSEDNHGCGWLREYSHKRSALLYSFAKRVQQMKQHSDLSVAECSMTCWLSELGWQTSVLGGPVCRTCICYLQRGALSLSSVYKRVLPLPLCKVRG